MLGDLKSKTMKLNKQVCSFELAKQLKELGFKQESYFIWVDKFPIFNNKEIITTTESFKLQLNNSILSEQAISSFVKTYPAFTVAELGDVLPLSSEEQGQIEWTCEKVVNGWEYDITEHYFRQLIYGIEKTEVDARSKMIICLKENKII